MEHPTKLLTRKPLFILLFLSFFSLAVLGQENEGSGSDKSSTTTTTTTKRSVSITSDNTANTWYTSPWVWVVGAAAFILLLVALLSGRGRDTVSTSDRVVTKTVERDRGRDG